MPQDCGATPDTAVPNFDLLREAVQIAKGLSPVQPTQAHLMVLCLQCDLFDERLQEANRLIAELARQMREAHEMPALKPRTEVLQ